MRSLLHCSAGSSLTTSILIRERREEERPGKDGGRDWGDVSTTMAGCTRSQEKGEEILSTGAPKRPILPTL